MLVALSWVIQPRRMGRVPVRSGSDPIAGVLVCLAASILAVWPPRRGFKQVPGSGGGAEERKSGRAEERESGRAGERKSGRAEERKNGRAGERR